MKKPQSLPPDLLENLAGRYDQFEYLDQGGMGAIYSAFDKVLDKKVAIKTLVYESLDNQALLRFQQEAKLQSKLEHPGIVRTLDFGVTEKNLPYLIMDFLPGKNLAELLEPDKSITWQAAIALSCQIARAMAFAHSKGINHRDLKTSNVLVDGWPENPRVTIIDFGLARAADQEDKKGKLTHFKSIVGSPLYMSPEQAEGNTGDHRSDVYALGCMIFRMIAGRTPFENDDTLKLLSLKRGKPPALGQYASIPQELEALVAKTLMPSPQDRYQDMVIIENSLAHILDNKDSVSSASETQTPVQAPIFNTKRYFLPVAALIAVISCSAYMAFNSPAKESLTAPPANSPQSKEAIQKELFQFIRDPLFDGDDGVKPIEPETFTDQDLAYLADFVDAYSKRKKTITSLDLSGTRINGSGFNFLEGLPINIINLNNTAIETEHFDKLKYLQEPKRISLKDVPITEAHIKAISAIGKIEELRLDNCPTVNAKLLEEIARLDLSHLTLNETQITDSDLAGLDNSNSLRLLELSFTRITDQGLKAIKHLKLNRLDLDSVEGLSSNALAITARQWPDLEILKIDKLPCSGASFKPLGKLKKLVELHAFEIPLSDEDMEIVGQLKDLKLFANTNGVFTKKGLARVVALKHLEYLTIINLKNVSPADLDALKPKLPKHTRSDISNSLENSDLRDIYEADMKSTHH